MSRTLISPSLPLNYLGYLLLTAVLPALSSLFRNLFPICSWQFLRFAEAMQPEISEGRYVARGKYVRARQERHRSNLKRRRSSRLHFRTNNDFPSSTKLPAGHEFVHPLNIALIIDSQMS